MAHMYAARRSLEFASNSAREGKSLTPLFLRLRNEYSGKKSFQLSGILTASFIGNGAKGSSVCAQADGDLHSANGSYRSTGDSDGIEQTISSPKKMQIPFEEYQKLKRKMKARQRIAGIPFAVVGLGTSSLVSAYLFPDMFDATPENVQLIMGIDPLIFCGLCGVVSCGIGYVGGTSLFRIFNKIMNKDLALKLEEREKDFLARIQSKRFADFSKFEDDYYGESIKTLSDYRQWLRTQEKKKNAAAKFIKAKEEETG